MNAKRSVLVSTSDVVETVTFETETWLKRPRPSHRDFIKNSETENRDFKICGFFWNFSKKCCHHF